MTSNPLPRTTPFAALARPGLFAMVRLLLFFLLVLLGMGGCSNPAAPGLRGVKLNATEKAMWSTYPLVTMKGTGTGFVVVQRDPHGGGSVPVLVTAAHILESAGKGPLIAAVRVPDSSGEPHVVAVPIPLPRTTGRFFVRHPRLDVGAFTPDLPAHLGAQVLPSFLSEKATGRAVVALRAGSEVSYLGFPDVLPGTSGCFPILRSGKVASYPTRELQAEGAFLINADVYPGDSGAPVFTVGRGRRPELAGMIVQRIGRTPGTFSHFAIAVDARAIRETLRLLAERDGSGGIGAAR